MALTLSLSAIHYTLDRYGRQYGQHLFRHFHDSAYVAVIVVYDKNLIINYWRQKRFENVNICASR